MKRKILLLPILSIIIAFSGCFSNEDKIPLNNEINEKINDYVAEHSQLVLDEYVYQLSGKTYPKGTVFE